jgi:hypothetical protein
MFEPRNLIERRLLEALDDPERREAFGQRLLTEKLYVSPLGPPDAQGHMPGLRAMPQPDGTMAIAIFTAPERVVEAFGPQALILVKDGRTLFDWLAPGPFQINPGFECTVILRPAEVKALLAGQRPPIAPRFSRLDLGLPFEPPTELIGRLQKALDPLPAVRAAHLSLAQREGRAAATWLLAVDTTGPWPDVQAAIAAGLQGFDLRARSLDVMPIDSADSPLRAGLPILTERAPRAALH